MGYTAGMSPRIDLTQEAINAARKWFADNALACAMAAHSRSDSVVLQNGEFYMGKGPLRAVDCNGGQLAKVLGVEPCWLAWGIDHDK